MYLIIEINLNMNKIVMNIFFLGFAYAHLKRANIYIHMHIYLLEILFYSKYSKRFCIQKTRTPRLLLP